MRCNNIIYRRLLVSSCLQFIIDLISNNRVSQYYCHDLRPPAQFSLFQAYNHEIWPPALSFFKITANNTFDPICFVFSGEASEDARFISSTADTDFSHKVPYIIRLPWIMRCGNVAPSLVWLSTHQSNGKPKTCLVLISRRVFITWRTVEFVCRIWATVTSCLCAKCSRTFCCCSKVCATSKSLKNSWAVI